MLSVTSEIRDLPLDISSGLRDGDGQKVDTMSRNALCYYSKNSILALLLPRLNISEWDEGAACLRPTSAVGKVSRLSLHPSESHTAIRSISAAIEGVYRIRPALQPAGYGLRLNPPGLLTVGRKRVCHGQSGPACVARYHKSGRVVLFIRETLQASWR
jgi:hypothetical protein